MVITDSTDLDVPCTCLCRQPASPLLPCIHDGQVHFLLLPPGTEDRLIASNLPQGYIASYNLTVTVNKSEAQIMSFSDCLKSICPTMLFYLNKITIFGSNSDIHINTGKRQVSLYQIIEGEHFYRWELIQNSEFSMTLDLKNTVCTSYGNDEVVVISVLNQVLTELSTGKITISLFSASKPAGKNWCQVHMFLPELSGKLNYKVQSCLTIANFIYCSVILEGTGAYVYEINLDLLHQCNKEIIDEHLPQKKLVIENHNLQSCFLVILNEKISVITFMNIYNETVMDIWPLADSSSIMMSKPAYRFNSIVKVAAASISRTQNILTVIYHDNKSKQCFAKRLKLQV